MIFVSIFQGSRLRPFPHQVDDSDSILSRIPDVMWSYMPDKWGKSASWSLRMDAPEYGMFVLESLSYQVKNHQMSHFLHNIHYA